MKKIKVLIVSIFALSLGLSVTGFAKKSTIVEPVSALSFDGEDPDEEPVSSGDPSSSEEEKEETSESKPEETSEASETSATESEESAPKQTEESGSGEKTATIGLPLIKEILKVIAKAFRDAWYDLKAHLKNWLKR